MRELQRIDQEQAEIEKMGATNTHPAWLIMLGWEDWEMERRIILASGEDSEGHAAGIGGPQ